MASQPTQGIGKGRLTGFDDTVCPVALIAGDSAEARARPRVLRVAESILEGADRASARQTVLHR